MPGLLLAWVSLQGGDLVGMLWLRRALAPISAAASAVSPTSRRLQRATAELDYRHQETNFTLGLAELNARLKRRALVILFTDFVDTVTAELMIESMQRVARRHRRGLRDPARRRSCSGSSRRRPSRFDDVAQAVIAHDFLRERSTVFERLERLGMHCLDVPSRGLPVALINRYLLIKQRGLI